MDIKTIFCLVMVILLVGCSGRVGTGVVSKSYYEGSKGLEIEFVGTSLPITIYERTSIPLSVLVSNAGAFDVNKSHPGKISFTYDDFYLENDEDNPLFNDTVLLHGKSYFYPEGEKSTAILPSFMGKVIKGPRERPETDLYVNLCYPYKTKLIEEVCIDTTSITHDAREQVCEAEDLRLSDQGAPVAITSVKVEMQPQGQMIRPVFLINIENKGSGNVLSLVSEDELDEACDIQYLKRGNWSKVKVSATLSTEELICYPEIVTLLGETGFTRCFSEGPQYPVSLNFFTPLKVELDYVYTTSISKKINIERTLKYTGEPLPLGECNYWEVNVGGVCQSKCSFCASNPTHAECLNLEIPSNAGCRCTPEECIIFQMSGGDDRCLSNTALCQDPYLCCIEE